MVRNGIILIAVTWLSYENSFVASSNGRSKVIASDMTDNSGLVSIVGEFSSRNNALDVVSDSTRNLSNMKKIEFHLVGQDCISFNIVLSVFPLLFWISLITSVAFTLCLQ